MITHHFFIFGVFVHSFIYRSGEALPPSSGESPDGKKLSTAPKKSKPAPDAARQNYLAQREERAVKEAQAELHDIAAKSRVIRDIHFFPNQIYKSADLLQMKLKMMDVIRLIPECLAPAQVEYLKRFTIYLHPGDVFTVNDRSLITAKTDWLAITNCFHKTSAEIIVEILTRLTVFPPPVPEPLKRQENLPKKQQLKRELRDLASSHGVNDIKLWDDEDYDVQDVQKNLYKIRYVLGKIAESNLADSSAPFRALPLVPIYLNPGSIFRSIGIKEGYHSKHKLIAIDYTESEGEILDDIRSGLADFVKTLPPAELKKRLDDFERKRSAEQTKLATPQNRINLFNSLEKSAKESRDAREKELVATDGRNLALSILSSKKLSIPTLQSDMTAISNIYYIFDRKSWQPLSPPQAGIETAENDVGIHFFHIRTKGGDRYLMRKDNSWFEPIVSQRDLDKFRDTSEQLMKMLRSIILASGRGLRASRFTYNPNFPGCLCVSIFDDISTENSIDAAIALEKFRAAVRSGKHPNFYLTIWGVIGSLDTEVIKRLRESGSLQ